MFNAAESLLGLAQYEVEKEALDKAVSEYKAKQAMENAELLIKETAPTTKKKTRVKK